MQKLFTEFNNTTAQQWKEQLVKDLKGIDFNTLIAKTNEGIDIQPFYTAEDISQKQQPIFTHNDWAICERIVVEDEKQANLQALEALSNGASGLEFIIKQKIDYSVLLNGILLEHIYSLFHIPLSEYQNLNNALQTVNKGNYCFINTDVISHLCETGNWVLSQNEDFKLIENNAFISVNASLYQNAGVNAVNELSFIVAQLNEYLNFYNSKNTLQQIKYIHLSVAVGGDFFKEIAKLRALRNLISFICKQYQIEIPVYIHGQTTSINKSHLDSYTNLLRSTTEAMSASIGGCNSITVLPFDSSFANETNFSLRMARNQQLILKEESYLNKVADMAAGSYYIESLTKTISNAAWEAFKFIETKGGFLEALKNNVIQDIALRDATLLQKQFEEGTLVLVGVNKFKNTTEVVPKIKVTDAVNTATLINPLKTIVLGS